MKERWTLIAILLLTALAYWPGLAGPLVLDDRANLEPLLRWMRDDLDWHSVVFNNQSGLFGRPIAMASFLANAATSGGSVYSMKATNLALHLCCGAVLYALLSSWVQIKAVAQRSSAAARWMPCAIAAIWLFHPLFVSTVLYVVQRMAILATFFTLITLLAYTHGRIALLAGHRGRGVLILAMVPIGTILAALSKENGALAPALCGLVELFMFRPALGKQRHPASRGFIAVSLALPALAAVAVVALNPPRLLGGYVNRDFTLTERLLTQTRVLWDYVGAVLFPYGPRLGLYHDDFQISHGLLSPVSTIVAIAGWVIVFVGAWRIRHKVPAVLFGLCFFIVAQALESTIFPLLMYFEHRMYLSTVGILWAIAGLATSTGPFLQKKMDHGKAIFSVALIGITLALGLATAARASVWRYQQSILAQALSTHPNSRWLRMDAVAFEMSRSPPNVPGAIRHADHLLTLPNESDRRFGAILRLSIECIEGDPIKPGRLKQVFGGHIRTIEPDLLVAYESLSGRITKHPCAGLSSEEMAEELDGLLDNAALPDTHRSMWRLRFQAARLYWAGDDQPHALEQARLAWVARPRDGAVPLFLAGMLLHSGQLVEAKTMLQSAKDRVGAGDATGRKILAQYEAALGQSPGPK
jgi:hypothetical protein